MLSSMNHGRSPGLKHPLLEKLSRLTLVPIVLALLSTVSVEANEASAPSTHCYEDLCVGDRAINVARDYRAVTIIAIDSYGKFVLRFDDTGGTGGNWDRFDLAVAWGCGGDLCVNDTVYNVPRGRRATIIALERTASGTDKFVLRFADTGGVGGGWDTFDLALISRGPIAYPPHRDTPNCPPGYEWNYRTQRCERIATPSCPPGYVWNYRTQRCERIATPSCPPGYVWNSRTQRCERIATPSCPPGYRWDPARQACVRNPQPQPPGDDWRCTINRPGRTFNGYGPTRSLAMTAVLRSCSNSGYSCRTTEAYCRQ